MPQTTSVLEKRRAREQEIVAATRAVWDERGEQDAQVEDVARAVGINKALIYRSFASKEDLFAATAASYLDELGERLTGIEAVRGGPPAQLRALTERFVDFCLEYPAFCDCALDLLRRPLADLSARVSDGVLLRLGQGMARCLAITADVLRRGEFGAVEDPEFTANVLYTQGLGVAHLARMGAGVREVAPGTPATFRLERARVREAAVDAALRVVGA